MSSNPLISVTMGEYRVGKDGISAHHIKQAIQLHMGKPFWLPAHTELLAAKLEDDCVAVTTQRFAYRQHRRSTDVLKKFRRIQIWMRTNGEWDKEPEIIEAEDVDFQPHSVAEGRRVTTPEEYHDQRNWEADCHRPGTGRTPLDNADRCLEDGALASPMTGYWDK